LARESSSVSARQRIEDQIDDVVTAVLSILVIDLSELAGARFVPGEDAGHPKFKEQRYRNMET
jgi:hypothetical protein